MIPSERQLVALLELLPAELRSRPKPPPGELFFVSTKDGLVIGDAGGWPMVWIPGTQRLSLGVGEFLIPAGVSEAVCDGTPDGAIRAMVRLSDFLRAGPSVDRRRKKGKR